MKKQVLLREFFSLGGGFPLDACGLLARLRELYWIRSASLGSACGFSTLLLRGLALCGRQDGDKNGGVEGAHVCCVHQSVSRDATVKPQGWSQQRSAGMGEGTAWTLGDLGCD